MGLDKSWKVTIRRCWQKSASWWANTMLKEHNHRALWMVTWRLTVGELCANNRSQECGIQGNWFKGPQARRHQADGPADAQVSSPREGGTQPSRTPPLSVSRENKQQEKGFLERENRRGPVEGLDQIAAQSWTRRNCGIGIWSGSVPPGSCWIGPRNWEWSWDYRRSSSGSCLWGELSLPTLRSRLLLSFLQTLAHRLTSAYPV